ncbi:MAG: RNA-protein complex protein Nop10 [Methanomassiliicoccaceae archaeon]|nr:RNA-protein complex protein Nop10 [Methanomassiliicoccaceae archaeon]
MRTLMKKCPECGCYSLKDECTCGSKTTTPLPAKYSPDDRYGVYRRKSITEEYGENGKCRDVRRNA